MLYNNFAVPLIRGTNFSIVGPGTSARITWMERSPAKGTMAMTKTNTPIPPIQWVKLLQNRIPLGSVSISVRILAPVVVNPDIVSKRLSIKDGIAPLI